MIQDWVQFAEGYTINRIGQVKTIERRSGPNKKLWKSIILSPGNCNGYRFVHISIKGKGLNRYIHRLVAQAFIPNPDNLPQVNHKNGIRHDNRVENLEWCTASYNQKHSFECLNRKSADRNGSKHPKAILTFKDVQDIIDAYKSKKATAKQLAQKYKVARNYIYVVAAKTTWKQDHLKSKLQ